MWVRTMPRWIEQEEDFPAPSEGSPGTITIHEDVQESFSGLLDVDGNPLHRERQPIGFISLNNNTGEPS